MASQNLHRNDNKSNSKIDDENTEITLAASAASSSTKKLDEVCEELSKLKELVNTSLKANSLNQENSSSTLKGKGNQSNHVPLNFKTYVKRELKRHDENIVESMLIPRLEKEAERIETRLFESLKLHIQEKINQKVSSKQKVSSDENRQIQSFPHWKLATNTIYDAGMDDQSLESRPFSNLLNNSNNTVSSSRPMMSQKPLNMISSVFSENGKAANSSNSQMKSASSEKFKKPTSNNNSANFKPKKRHAPCSTTTNTSHSSGRSKMAYAKPTFSSTSKSKYNVN